MGLKSVCLNKVKDSLLDMAGLFAHGPHKRDSKWIKPIKGDFCLVTLVALQYPMNVLI